MNFLKRELAPLVDEAWRTIEQEAVRVLKANLSARHIVDFDGPKGFDFSAVNLGRLKPADEESEGVHYGIRNVLPLVELRVPFTMNQWELDNLARGALDIDTGPVVEAALRVAAFEERAIYLGFEPAGIVGMRQAAQHEALTLGNDASRYPDIVARAMLTLSDEGVGGPYGLILGDKAFRLLSGDVSVYPPRKRIARIIKGRILHSSVLEGGFLVSLRGRDFVLTVGQDASMGYEQNDSKTVRLYLTESFTFRVIEPQAIVPLDLG